MQAILVRSSFSVSEQSLLLLYLHAFFFRTKSLPSARGSFYRSSKHPIGQITHGGEWLKGSWRSLRHWYQVIWKLMSHFISWVCAPGSTMKGICFWLSYHHVRQSTRLCEVLNDWSHLPPILIFSPIYLLFSIYISYCVWCRSVQELSILL